MWTTLLPRNKAKMSPPPLFHHRFLLLVLLLITPPTAWSSSSTITAIITTLCSQTHYPTLCVRTLSATPLPSTSPSDLARASVSASLAAARSTSSFLSHLPSPIPGPLHDCRSLISGSNDLLSRTAFELTHLRPHTFKWQMDNAMTWASAAMTNADTCIDGVRQQQQRESPTKGTATAAVVRRAVRVSRVTSNALFFLNRLAVTSGRRGI